MLLKEEALRAYLPVSTAFQLTLHRKCPLGCPYGDEMHNTVAQCARKRDVVPSTVHFLWRKCNEVPYKLPYMLEKFGAVSP